MSILADPNYTPSVQNFSLTTGGTAQLLAAGNQRRQALWINPVTEASIIQFGATAGTQASGTLTAGANTVNTETIVVNGVTFTFVTGASTATNVHIGATKEDTMTNFQAVLAASVNASITVATYAVAANVITITFIAGGTTGNAYTLANSSGTVAITRSAATLANGSNTVGGLNMVTGTGGYTLNAAQFPSIRGDIYIVSATSAAKTNYLEGFGG